jgi:hypothetical protein
MDESWFPVWHYPDPEGVSSHLIKRDRKRNNKKNNRKGGRGKTHPPKPNLAKENLTCVNSRSKYCFLRAEPSNQSVGAEYDPLLALRVCLPFRLKKSKAEMQGAMHTHIRASQRISALSSDQKTYRVMHSCGLRCNAVF